MTAPLDAKALEEGARIYDGLRLVYVIQNGKRVRPKGWNEAKAAQRRAKRFAKHHDRLVRRGLFSRALKLSKEYAA